MKSLKMELTLCVRKFFEVFIIEWPRKMGDINVMAFVWVSGIRSNTCEYTSMIERQTLEKMKRK